MRSGRPPKDWLGEKDREIFMIAKINRPPVVWLAQILLGLFVILWLFVILLNLRMVLLDESSNRVSLILLVPIYAILVGFLLLLLTAFWGLARRRMYGRWLSVLSLTLMWGLIILGQLFRPSGPYKYYEYENSAQVAGAIIFAIIFHSLVLVVILRLAFSKRVTAFLRSETATTSDMAQANLE